MSADNILAELEKKEISLRGFAELINLSPATISLILNGKYKGNPKTIDKVYSKLDSIINCREDLSDDIYDNASMFYRLINIGIKHKNFNNDETAQLITIANKINKFIEHKNHEKQNS